MTETAMKLSKNDQHYTDLVEGFLKDPAYANVDRSEKEKFLQLCVVNKLNPFKKEVYPVPYGKKLQITVAYTKYLEIAEQSGLLAGRTVLIKKTPHKIVTGGKITIHRKDWNHAFEYEADIEDFAVSSNPLRKSKAEAMMRKQLIRVGFSLCFPENCKTLEVDPDGEPEVIIQKPGIVNDSPIYGPDGDRIEGIEDVDENIVDAGVAGTPGNDYLCGDKGVRMVSQEQKDMIDRLCVALVDFQEEPRKPENYDEAEILIRAMQFQVGKLYLKENKLQNLTEFDIEAIFSGDDADIKKVKEAAKKHFKSIQK